MPIIYVRWFEMFEDSVTKALNCGWAKMDHSIEALRGFAQQIKTCTDWLKSPVIFRVKANQAITSTAALKNYLLCFLMEYLATWHTQHKEASTFLFHLSDCKAVWFGVAHLSIPINCALLQSKTIYLKGCILIAMWRCALDSWPWTIYYCHLQKNKKKINNSKQCVSHWF